LGQNADIYMKGKKH